MLDLGFLNQDPGELYFQVQNRLLAILDRNPRIIRNLLLRDERLIERLRLENRRIAPLLFEPVPHYRDSRIKTVIDSLLSVVPTLKIHNNYKAVQWYEPRCRGFLLIDISDLFSDTWLGRSMSVESQQSMARHARKQGEKLNKEASEAKTNAGQAQGVKPDQASGAK